MPAPEGNQNAVGNTGGKTVNDRKKAARARSLILDEVIRLFETDPLRLSETELARKGELLLRMAPNTLPRLTEVTGEDGQPLIIQMAKEVALKNDIDVSNPLPSDNSLGQPPV